jgi:CRP-like cAMP-binding protein
MKSSNSIECLRSFPLFDTLNPEEFDWLTNVLEHKTKVKHAVLFEAGEPSDKVFFLLKGTVKTSKLSEDGREAIKTIMHPVSVFGELGLIGELFRHESAYTMNEEVEYCTLANVDFQHLMRTNHSICLKMLQFLGDRLLKAEQKLESLIFKDARGRIIDFLKESAANRGRQVGYEMMFKHCLTQQDIANLTGTSRQTVTSVLNDLRKENLIYFNRNSILIRDLGKLS